MKEINFTTIKINEPPESFQSKRSQQDPVDYDLLVNKPTIVVTKADVGL